MVEDISNLAEPLYQAEEAKGLGQPYIVQELCGNEPLLYCWVMM